MSPSSVKTGRRPSLDNSPVAGGARRRAPSSGSLRRPPPVAAATDVGRPFLRGSPPRLQPGMERAALAALVVVEEDVALFGEDGEAPVLRQLARRGRRRPTRLVLGELAQARAVGADDVCVRLLLAGLARALPAEVDAAAVPRPDD